VFGSGGDDSELYTIRPDGSELRRVATSPGADRDPTWSPDGTRIAFASTRDGNLELYVMHADGTGVTRITNDAAADGSPAWSPDGSTIAFVSSRDSSRSGGRDLYRVRPDGTRLERLTVGASVTTDVAAWSPDGSRVAFHSAHGGNDYDVELVRIADHARSTLAQSKRYEGMYAWSPDGKRLALISARDSAEAMYVIDADGTNLRRLTTDQTLNPAWSR
jgi:Tol biopolymer transport system component